MSFFYNLLTSGGGQGDIILGQNSDIVTFAAADVEASNINFSHIYYPWQIWDNGRTIISMMKSHTAPYDEMPYALIYDEGYGFLNPYEVEPSTSADTHASPLIAKGDNDYYYIIQPRPHATPLRIQKSYNTNDPTSWEHLAETLGTGKLLGIPSIIKKDDGNYVCFAQDLPTPFNTPVYYWIASDGLEDWDSGQQLTGNSGVDNLYVTSIPSNYKVSYGGHTWYHIVLSKRVSNELWRYNYVLKTHDFITWHNQQETFSKNVVSNGFIDNAELDANFLVNDVGATNQGYAPVSGVSPSGNIFIVAGNDLEDYILLYHNGSSWTSKAITIPDLLDGAVTGDPTPQSSPFKVLICRSDTNFELIALTSIDISGTDYAKPTLYRTTDALTSATLIGDLFPLLQQNLFLSSFPANYLEIPNNRSFYISACHATVNPSAVYCAKLAFGSSISPDDQTLNITPVNSLSDVSGLTRHYKISASTITNTGTTLTSLIDQSGQGQNGTPEGSPVIDSAVTPTMVTFDGTNDAVSVPVTGLTAVPAFTVIAVARITTTPTRSAAFFSCANTGFADRFFALSISNDATFNKSTLTSFRNGGVANANCFGSTNLSSDTLFAIVTIVVDGSNYEMHINGKKEIIRFVEGGGNARQLTGNGINDITGGISNIFIGALKRNTNIFYSFNLKEWAIYNRAISLEEKRGIEKRLSIDHGITLTDEYI